MRGCPTLVLRCLEDMGRDFDFFSVFLCVPCGEQPDNAEKMKGAPEGPRFSQTTNDQRRFAQPTFCGTRGSGIAAAIFAPKYFVRAFSNFSISTCFNGC